MKKLLVAAIILFATMSAYAEVTLNGIFTDHMMLQRDIPVSVYGTAAPGEKVTVTFVYGMGAGTLQPTGRSQAGEFPSDTALPDARRGGVPSPYRGGLYCLGSLHAPVCREFPGGRFLFWAQSTPGDRRPLGFDQERLGRR